MGVRSLRMRSHWERRTAASVIVISLVTMVASTGSPVARAATLSQVPSETTVVTVQPFGPDGSLRTDLRVRRTLRNGSCIPNRSAKVVNAAICFRGRYRYDPCWEDPNSSGASLICLSAPWEQNVTRMLVRKPLREPVPLSPSSQTPYPWGIELIDGSRCLVHAGAHDSIGGIAVDFYCEGDRVLLRTLDRSQPLWSIGTAEIRKKRYLPGPVMPIRTVWS
jgi:hypothetical protein